MTETKQQKRQQDDKPTSKKIALLILGPSALIIIGACLYLFGARYEYSD